MDNTFFGSQRSMQPQTHGSAPRAANPGTGMGNRAYAPGIMRGLNGGPPLPPSARQVAPPTAPGQNAPYRATDVPTQPPAAPAAGGAGPRAGGAVGAADPAMTMMQARARAQALIDALIARANASQAARRRGY